MEDKVSANPVEADPTGDVKQEEPKTYSAEQYGKLQTQLQSFQRRNKELVRQSAESSSEAALAAKRAEEAVGGMIAVLANSPSFDGQKKDFETLGEALKGKREKDTSTTRYVREAAEFVEERGVDWYNDERLGEANKLWNEGKLAESIEAAKKAIPTATLDEEEINRRADALYQAKMKETNRVDTGGATTGGAKLDWKAAQKAKNVSDVSDADYERLVAQK